MKVERERVDAGRWSGPAGSVGGVRIDRVPMPALPNGSGRESHGYCHAGAVRLRERYEATPRQVFDAWLDPGVAGRWLFATASAPMAHVRIDARPGGAFRLADRRHGAAVAFAGRYVEIVPHRRLVFTLSTPRNPVASLVTVTVATHGRGSMLELAHEHLTSDEARYLEHRWTGILYGLGVTLDAMPQTSTHPGSPR